MDAEPPNVAIILDCSLRIRASSAALRTELKSLGYSTSRDRHGVNVHFEHEGDYLDSESLIRILQELSALGVAFAADYKQLVSPADHVALLIERGVDFEQPRSCAFDGNRWKTSDYPWGTY